MGEFVRLEVDDGVGVIRIDRQPANAIDLQVGLELGEAVREAEGRSDVGAVFEEAVKDARSFAGGPRQALAAAKHAIRAATEMSGSDGMRVERDLFLDLFGTVDQREGMRAFLEKRPPRFGGRRG